MISDLNDDLSLVVSATVSSAICGPFMSARIAGRVLETKQAVRIVDQQVELAQKIFAEDTAKVEIDGIGILEVKHEYLLVGDRMEPLRAGRLARRKRLHEIRLLLPRPSPGYSDGAQRPERD